MLSLYKIVTLEPEDTIEVQLSGSSRLKRSGVILPKIYSWWFLMIMIAFITFKSSLVHLFEGL